MPLAPSNTEVSGTGVKTPTISEAYEGGCDKESRTLRGIETLRHLGARDEATGVTKRAGPFGELRPSVDIHVHVDVDV